MNKRKGKRRKEVEGGEELVNNNISWEVTMPCKKERGRSERGDER